MAETFDEGSTFYREHQQTWSGFVKWGMRGTCLAATLVIIAFIFIVS